jgi:hypothetical protein
MVSAFRPPVLNYVAIDHLRLPACCIAAFSPRI